MNPIQWLEENSIGFRGLTRIEQDSLMHFTLLWSIFEAQALQSNASVAVIDTWIRNLASNGNLDSTAFNATLNYFKSRYYINNQPTEHFYSLNLRKNDNANLVENVLSGENIDSTEGVIVVFIIIFRFRNNYFHGAKWTYEFKDQLDNFNFSNKSIMDIMKYV